VARIEEKIASDSTILKDWRATSLSTDFGAAP
jgi:hypothetical protein